MLPKEVQQLAGGNEEHCVQLTHQECYTIRKLSTTWQGIQGMIQPFRNRRRVSSQLKVTGEVLYHEPLHSQSPLGWPPLSQCCCI